MAIPKHRIWRILFFLVAAALFSCPAFAQQMGRSNMERGNVGGPIAGEVEQIEATSITIRTDHGESRTFTISSRTRFIRETPISQGDLKSGDTVRVMGRRTAGEATDAVLISVLAGGNEEKPFGGRQGQGPIMGEIAGLDPLEVKTSNGYTAERINVTGRTRIMREESVSSADIQAGAAVHIIAPDAGRGGSGEAMIVILGGDTSESRGGQVFERGAARRPKEEAAASSPSIRADMSLLPELPMQEKKPEFLYGIWLGRGLYSHEELDRAFIVARNLGVRFFKIEFKWDFVEPRDNSFTWNSRETLDVEYVVELARKYDMSIIPYFDNFMPWGRMEKNAACEGPPSGRGQAQAPDPEKYADYVFHVVDRLMQGGVDVRYIEIDNEPSNQSDGYESVNCFIDITAAQLKEAGNAAYDKVKAVYPGVLVSSTTFSFPGVAMRDLEADTRRRNSFIQAYFGKDPKPKFDFLGLHETVSGSGNPYTSLPGAQAEGKYIFASYNDAYTLWRRVLDSYGYRSAPIMNLESTAVITGKQDAILLQRAVFARANSDNNRVAGWVLSQLTGSRKFTEGGGGARVKVGIADLTRGYTLREGYFGYYTLIKTLARYPEYEGRILGEINGSGAVVEKFSDAQGNLLYAVFVPYDDGPDVPQTVVLNLGAGKDITITRSDASAEKSRSGTDGTVDIAAGQKPVFVEVARR